MQVLKEGMRAKRIVAVAQVSFIEGGLQAASQPRSRATHGGPSASDEARKRRAEIQARSRRDPGRDNGVGRHRMNAG